MPVAVETGSLMIHAGLPDVQIKVISRRGGESRELGTTGKGGMLGPISVPVGTYDVVGVLASSHGPAAGRTVARADNVPVAAGAPTKVVLTA